MTRILRRCQRCGTEFPINDARAAARLHCYECQPVGARRASNAATAIAAARPTGERIRRISVPRRCQDCGEPVMLQPDGSIVDDRPARRGDPHADGCRPWWKAS